MPYLPTPIPHEIWHEIFRIATDVPDPLVCFAQDYHGFRRDASQQPYKRYIESLMTKLIICSVSREWNAVATPLLYERIIVARPEEDHKARRREIRRLIRTLGDSLAPPEPSNSPPGDPAGRTSLWLGAFVRRLDLTFPEGREGTEYSDENVSRTLSQLVEKLPNLQILGLRTSSRVSPLNTLGVLSQKLKHLHWRTATTVADFKIPIIPFLSFLENHPGLETVQMMYNFEDIELGLEATFWEGKPRPSIRHWVLRQNQVNVLAAIPTATFPNLERVTYPYYPHARVDNLERFTNFVSVHGSRLETLRMSPHKQLKCMLEATAKWCPRLTEIHLIYKRSQPSSYAVAQASAVVTMPRITTLGLSLYNYDEKEHTAEWQRAFTLAWKDIFPNLQTIKLLGVEDAESLREMTEESEIIINHCHDYGVNLRDDSGHLFTLDGN